MPEPATVKRVSPKGVMADGLPRCWPYLPYSWNRWISSLTCQRFRPHPGADRIGRWNLSTAPRGHHAQTGDGRGDSRAKERKLGAKRDQRGRYQRRGGDVKRNRARGTP